MAYDDLVDMEPDELRQRITELEQQLANANNKLELMRGCVDRDSNCYLHMFDRAEAAESKLTERDKLLDECQQYLERFPDYPVFVRLLTKLRDRKKEG